MKVSIWILGSINRALKIKKPTLVATVGPGVQCITQSREVIRLAPSKFGAASTKKGSQATDFYSWRIFRATA